jgi:hypothetical protein
MIIEWLQALDAVVHREMQPKKEMAGENPEVDWYFQCAEITAIADARADKIADLERQRDHYESICIRATALLCKESSIETCWRIREILAEPLLVSGDEAEVAVQKKGER